MERQNRDEKTVKNQILLLMEGEKEGVSFETILSVLDLSDTDAGYLHILLLDMCRDGLLKIEDKAYDSIRETVFYSAGIPEKHRQTDAPAVISTVTVTEMQRISEDSQGQDSAENSSEMSHAADNVESQQKEKYEEQSVTPVDEYAEELFVHLIKVLKSVPKWMTVRDLLNRDAWPKDACSVLAVLLVQIASEGIIEIRTERDGISGVRPEIRYCGGGKIWKPSAEVLAILNSAHSPETEMVEADEPENADMSGADGMLGSSDMDAMPVAVQTSMIVPEEHEKSGEMQEQAEQDEQVVSDEPETSVDSQTADEPAEPVKIGVDADEMDNVADDRNVSGDTVSADPEKKTPEETSGQKPVKASVPMSQEEIQEEIFRVLFENPGYHSVEGIKQLSERLRQVPDYKIIFNANMLHIRDLTDEIITSPPDPVMYLYAAKGQPVTKKETAEPDAKEVSEVKPGTATNGKKTSESREGREFINYCWITPLSYAYKMILILAFMEKADTNGSMNIDDAVPNFRKFYMGRRSRGLMVEKGKTVFADPDATDTQLRRNIIENPVKALTTGGYFQYDAQNRLFSMKSSVWTMLDDWDRTEIVRVCKKRLEQYFGRL